ncbi:MAG: hypothetical protein HGA65_17550, partial [Oscillochloris sp.]|nr:hypothetical protein [Oscillochloris sp.]
MKKTSDRSLRTAILAVTIGLLILLMACAISGFMATSRPNARRWMLDTPPIGGHVYSLWVLPCDAFNPGQIILGHNLMVYSRYPPPGFSVP